MRDTATPYRFNFFQRLAFRCAGSSIEGLLRCPESEHRKYGFIGAIILLTSLFAMLSGGYALFYIFRSQAYAAVFAFMWGFFILNLDRFIVSSMRKSNSFWREIRQAIPRLTLAIIIAITIARPLEIGMFSDEINKYLVEMKNVKKFDVLKDFNVYIDKIKDGFEAQNARDQSLLEEYQKQAAVKCGERDTAFKRYLCERDGTCGTGTKGFGSEAAEKQRYYGKIDRECTELSARARELYAGLQKRRNAFEMGLTGNTLDNMKNDNVAFMQEAAEITKLKEERDRRLREVETTYSTSFSAMNSALWNLQKADPSVMAISIVLSLLFVIVEIAPVTVKLLSPKGPYDYVLDAERDRAEAEYLRGRQSLYMEKSTDYDRQAQDYERQKRIEVLRAFHEAKAPLEKQALMRMLEEWKSNPNLSAEAAEGLSKDVSRMLEDYARKAEAYDRGAAAQQPQGALYETDTIITSPEQKASETSTLVSRGFLLVPITFLVTTLAYITALKFEAPVSPYLIAFMAGVTYVTATVIYYGVKESDH